MRIYRALMMISLGVSVSACATTDLPSRNAPFETLPEVAVEIPDGYEMRLEAPDGLVPHDIVPVIATGTLAEEVETPQSKYPVSISSVVVKVSRKLKVSEANRYLPSGDIVWREDPPGDRHKQVATIVQAAMEQGVAQFDGPRDITLEIEVLRFHALTEKARYTTGGVHAISFMMQLRDAKTGVAISEPRQIDADLEAFGGQKALDAMARGETQKLRITRHLAEVIQQEIIAPGSHKNARLGFFQVLNKI